MKCQELDLDSVLPDQEMLMKLMIHPLQIQVRIQAFILIEFLGYVVRSLFYFYALNLHCCYSQNV